MGLGLMGHGIAQVTAQKGFEVVAVEASEEAVSRVRAVPAGRARLGSTPTTPFRRAWA